LKPRIRVSERRGDIESTDGAAFAASPIQVKTLDVPSSQGRCENLAFAGLRHSVATWRTWSSCGPHPSLFAIMFQTVAEVVRLQIAAEFSRLQLRPRF